MRSPNGSWRVIDLGSLDADGGAEGPGSEVVPIDGLAIVLKVARDRRTAIVVADGAGASSGIVSIPCLRFAADRLVAAAKPAAPASD